MWIQSGDGDARSVFGSTAKKIREQQTNADNLRLSECIRNFAQRDMGCNKRHRELSAPQAHCEILHATAFGEKFGLPGKRKTRFVHPGFMNGARYHRIKFAAPCKRDCFLKRPCGGTRSFEGRLP